MCFFVEDGFTKEDADVKVFVGEGWGWDWAGMVEDRWCCREFDLVLFWGVVIGDLFFKFVDSLDDLFKLLVNEIFHVVGVALDLDDEIPVMFFQLSEREDPVGRDYLLFLWVEWLKEHVGFKVDFGIFQENLKESIEMIVLQRPWLEGERVALSD